ncbi:MAG: response regulator transcription factor [Leptolyngbyaceae cyanobacterium CSU_1_3]|nr:response regulator transcription factor [Leptolyngbyaceae cyanobacterium CSU_1_3]
MRSSGASQPASQPPCILVVEDETSIRELVSLALREEGYQVITADEGRRALDLIANTPVREDGSSSIDLIVLDLMLPYINGLDICRLLRQQGNLTPILILSARGTEMDIVVGLEIGADDYLAKPFSLRELIARCRALLRRSNSISATDSEQPLLQFQDIILYLQEYKVKVRGEEVNLSPKEFMLLELFLQNPRRVFSRDQLLERVWGTDSISDPKTVDVHIRWLREKLEIDPSSPQYIITVRGFGYRLG